MGGRACLVDPERPSRFPSATERRHLADVAVHGHFLSGEQEIIGTQFPLPGEELRLQPARGRLRADTTDDEGAPVTLEQGPGPGDQQSGNLGEVLSRDQRQVMYVLEIVIETVLRPLLYSSLRCLLKPTSWPNSVQKPSGGFLNLAS